MKKYLETKNIMETFAAGSKELVMVGDLQVHCLLSQNEKGK